MAYVPLGVRHAISDLTIKHSIKYVMFNLGVTVLRTTTTIRGTIYVNIGYWILPIIIYSDERGHYRRECYPKLLIVQLLPVLPYVARSRRNT